MAIFRLWLDKTIEKQNVIAREIARGAGYPQALIARIKQKRQHVTLDMAIKLAEELGHKIYIEDAIMGARSELKPESEKIITK